MTEGYLRVIIAIATLLAAAFRGVTSLMTYLAERKREDHEHEHHQDEADPRSQDGGDKERGS